MFPCPHCKALTSEVLETRLQLRQAVRRRRYECKSCKDRFTTYERYSPHQTKAEKALMRIAAKLAAVRLEMAGTSNHHASRPAPVPIQELELGMYAYNSLKSHGVQTIDALLEFSSVDLLSLRNFGVGSLDEVQRALAMRGLALRPEQTSTD